MRGLLNRILDFVENYPLAFGVILLWLFIPGVYATRIQAERRGYWQTKFHGTVSKSENPELFHRYSSGIMLFLGVLIGVALVLTAMLIQAN